jgi:acetyl/propionyl-CoA carboxylase alpha subunit
LTSYANRSSVATARRIAITQEAVTFNGHAIECRINNAENPENLHAFARSGGAIIMHPAGSVVRRR